MTPSLQEEAAHYIHELAQKLVPTPTEAEANARRYEAAAREDEAFIKENTPPSGLTEAEEEERVYQNILRAEREIEVRDRLDVSPKEAKFLVEKFSKELGYPEEVSTQAAETSTAATAETTTAMTAETATTTSTTAAIGTETVAAVSPATAGETLVTAAAETESAAGAELAGETLVGAAAEEGLAAGATVGAAGGFEIPVWGWIGVGVAVAGGVGYGIYKHYHHKHEADAAAQKQGFAHSAQALDAAKAGFKNPDELHFVDEAIKKAGMGKDLADYARKHGHDTLEDFMKTADHGHATNGHNYALSWGYAAPVETRNRRHFDKAQLVEVRHILAGTASVEEVKDVQREVKAEGFDIGKFGVSHDGVDGIAGRFTHKAIAAAQRRLKPSSTI